MDCTQVFQQIESQWEPLFALCDDPALFAARNETVSGWSVGEQVAHVSLSLLHIASGIEDLVVHPEKNSQESEKPFTAGVLDAGTLPRGRGQSPEPLIWEGTPKPDEVRTKLQRARGRWRTFQENQAKVEAINGRFKHFAFGWMTPAQWARFTAIHTAHHLAIVRDILGPTPLPTEEALSTEDAPVPEE